MTGAVRSGGESVSLRLSARRTRGWGVALLVLLPLLTAAVVVSGNAARAAETVTFETDTLAIVTAEGATHRFTVDLARTPRQQARGLMYRERLAPDRGMLFLHARPHVATMWMKNTRIPLDMLFIAADGRIVKIAERTVPHSTRAISAGRPVKAVLELRGGTADRLGLSRGDRVRYPAFEPDN